MKGLLIPCQILALFLVFFVSCSKHDSGPTPATPVLSLSRTSISAGSITGFSDTFTVQSTINWKLEITTSNSGWLQVDNTSGGPGKTIIRVSVITSNTTNVSKSATITLSPVGTTTIQPQDLTVSQKVYALGWQATLGGYNSDMGNAITGTADGGYVVAGNSNSYDYDITGNHGDYDMWVVRQDKAGHKVWETSLGGSGADWANAIAATSDGGFVVAGFTTSNDGDVSGNHGGTDIWVVKLDGNGNKIWQKCLGGSYSEQAYSIAVSADGGYVVAGITSSKDGDVTGSHGADDMWVVKLDGNGKLLWQKCLGGKAYDVGKAIIGSTDGGYVIAGITASTDGDVTGNHGAQDMWVVKLDGNGNLLWQKCLGGAQNDAGNSIAASPDGGYVVAGQTQSTDGDITVNHGKIDMWVVKLDGNGNKVWQNAFGGSQADYGNGIIATPDGGYAITGTSYSNDGDVSGTHGDYDVWAVRLNSNGTLLWSKLYGSSAYDNGTSIIAAPDGGFAIAGMTLGNDGDVAGNHGSYDYWVIKLQ